MVSSEFRVSFEEVSRKFRGSFEVVSSEFRVSFEEVSRKFRGSFDKV